MALSAGAGPLAPIRDAPLGGQAVLEGVMMRGVRSWAVAVRRQGQADAAGALARGEISVSAFPIPPRKKPQIARLPVIRGVVGLGQSLALGMRALGISANEALAQEAGRRPGVPVASASGGLAAADRPPEIPRAAWIATVAVSVAFAVGLFFVVPVGATSLIRRQLGSPLLFWLVEGALRTTILLGYLAAMSRLRDLRRVFEYHGAEHKVIACYEAGDELTPERAALYPRLHPRCGTSFLLVVAVLGIFVLAPVGLPAWWLLVLSRILGVPLIAGLSFEVIRWAARHRKSRWVRALMLPGLTLQRLTTREPDSDQLAVSIAALRAVLEREAPGIGGRDELPGLELVA
ncbi:MAG TPA: DUF1385 domain-containing protein [Solirubrobacteraceae bacterium]|nr:DUF1385 domain-containing protein [Solirubrobacteraceae bacterium]